MATLKIKNKYQMTLMKLVKEAKDSGALPDIIEIDGKEAWDILNEIRLVGGNKGFIVKAGDEYDPQFELKGSKERLDRTAAQNLINRWWKGEFDILFNFDKTEQIPLKVINAKKPPPKPKFPPNETIIEGKLPKKPVKTTTKTVTIQVHPVDEVDKSTDPEDNTE